MPLSRFSIPTEAQIETFVWWLNTPEVVQYSEQRHYTHSPESQKIYWDRVQISNKRYWFIKNKNDGPSDIIGAVSADFDPQNLTSNLSIMIGDRSYWGRGFGKEAFGAIIENERLCGMKKLEAGMMASNTAMIKTCLACGMREEACVPWHFRVGDERVPLISMGITL